VDVLLFIFVISIFILEIRHLRPQFVVKVVRSPDGLQEEYTIGQMSIQQAAVWLLEEYYKDFGVYNPWLENAHRKRGAGQLIRMEHANSTNNISASKRGRNRNANMSAASSVNNFINNMDNNEDKTADEDNCNFSRSNMSKKKMNSSRGNANASRAGSIVGGNYSANDRFYEEYEYERRLRKRRARLLTSTEEAFTHIKRFQSDNGSIYKGSGMSSTLMDPYEAAQAIFTTIARDLRRYLRVTRQQPYFTRDSIVAHLANCVSYDMSPRAFLQRYLNAEPLIFNEKALFNSSTMRYQKLALSKINTSHGSSHGVNYHMSTKTLDQSWILICDTVLYQNIEDNLMLVLKQNEVSLMCTFRRLPRFNLIEDILDPKRNKFVLKLNSETTV
jgi:vang-like